MFFASMGPFSQPVFTTIKNLNRETQEQGSSCIDGRFAYIATQVINTRDVKTDIFVNVYNYTKR